MKKSKFFLPLGLVPLTVLPAMAIAGCNPPNDTTVVERTANSGDAISMTGNEIIVNGKAPEATEAASKPAKTAKPAASAGKPDPAYRVKKDGPPGMEKVIVPPPSVDFKVPANAKVKFETTKGSFTIQLNTKEAPLHTKSFYYLAKRGFYNGVTFHRYADLTGAGGFIIQGGDPLTRSEDTKQYAGGGGPGYEIPREYNNLKHDKLVIAAARSSDPDSAGSQFYFTFTEIPFLDEAPGYTVFGKVVEGGNNVLKLRQDDVIKKATAL